MSMISCMYCDEVGDAKDAWLGGIYNPDPPHDFICPGCVDMICDTHEFLPDAGEIIAEGLERDLFAVANGGVTQLERELPFLADPPEDATPSAIAKATREMAARKRGAEFW